MSFNPEIPVNSQEQGVPIQDFSDISVQVPELYDLMDWNKYDVFSNINCVSIGTIVSFDATKQNATISINYQRFFGPNQNLPYPEIRDCPVVILRGGAGRITFPIAPGDHCLVLFCDRDIDAWYTTGNITLPNSLRMHDISDAIALVGITHLNEPLENYNTTGSELSHGSAKIIAQDATKASLETTISSVLAKVSAEDKILISVAGATLKTALDTLCSALLAWVDTNGDTPNPATQAAITAAQGLIDGVLK